MAMTKANGKLVQLLRDYLKIEQEYDSLERKLASLQESKSKLAKAIIDEHGTAPLLVNGVRYLPMARRRTAADGHGGRVERGISYYLRRDSDKESVEVTL